MFGPSSALERSKQRPPQTVVAFFVACGFEDALAAPAAARPRDEAMAADAATTQSPLVKRVRMVIPSLWMLGRPPSRWHGRSSSGRPRLTTMIAVTSCGPALSASADRYLTMSSCLISDCELTDGIVFFSDWRHIHEIDVPLVNAVDAIQQIRRSIFGAI